MDWYVLLVVLTIYFLIKWLISKMWLRGLIYYMILNNQKVPTRVEWIDCCKKYILDSLGIKNS